MKKLIPLFAFALILHLSASAAVPLKWTVETSRATPATFEAYQGETLALEASLMSYGKPLEAPSNYSLYWQTNGMGSTYWSAPCVATASSPSNVLFATWSPTNDVGAKVYNCFIGQPGTIYHAAFQLRLRPSPGATPNELPLPQKVIDFAKVTVLNPPWSGGGGGGVETNDVKAIVNAEVGGTNTLVHSEQISDMETQIAALQGGKRDKDDRAIYKQEFSRFSWSCSNAEVLSLIGINQPTIVDGLWECPAIYEGWHVSQVMLPLDTLVVSFDYWRGDDPDTGEHAIATATRTKILTQKDNQQLAAVATGDAQTPANGDLMKYDAANDRLVKAEKSSTSADPANADYRDPQDNTCHKTEYGIWVANGVPDGVTFVNTPQPEMHPPWLWFDDDGTGWNGNSIDVDATELTFTDGADRSFTATRSAVCTKDEKFVTQSFVKNSLSAKQDALPYPTNAIPASAITGLEPPSSQNLRVYDDVRQCWWIGTMVNGVLNWEVE